MRVFKKRSKSVWTYPLLIGRKSKHKESFDVYLPILSNPQEVKVNFTCFIGNTQSEGDGEESGHLETENYGEIYVFLPLYGLSIA